jgi:anti-sigma B factor antagonist
MRPQQPRARPVVEHHDGVTVVTLTAGQPRDHGNMIARELEGLTEDCRRGLVLDFRNVSFIQSDELGTLVTLHKKMTAASGRLTLTNLTPLVREVFAVTKLDRVLEIRPPAATAG